MEENKESIVGVMEKLAMITDATQSLFPDGKTAIVFELPEVDFKEIQKMSNLNKKFIGILRDNKEKNLDFSIPVISGTIYDLNPSGDCKKSFKESKENCNNCLYVSL